MALVVKIKNLVFEKSSLGKLIQGYRTIGIVAACSISFQATIAVAAHRVFATLTWGSFLGWGF
ncbi:MAG: hypothetical protein EB127_28595 [Alphaproteobacteria bacterium]|nr:hypothetical protein [Alphaproteobacteria bacterium]